MTKICEICNKSFDTEKEFKLDSGNTMSWKEYKSRSFKMYASMF